MKNEKAPRAKGAYGKILKSVREYKKISLGASIFVFFEVVLEVFIPLIMAQIINVGMDESISEFTFQLEFGTFKPEIFTVDNRIVFIVTCGALMVLMALLSLCCGVLSGICAAKGSAGFAQNLRKDLFYKVENFSFANLDKYNTASLVTRLTTDITNIQNAYQMVIRLFVRAPFMLILAVCMAVSISPNLSIIFAVVLPILLLGLLIGLKAVYPRFERMLRKYDELNESTQENLISIRAVKAFVREDFEIKKFKNVSSSVQKLQLSAERIMVLTFPFMQILVYACMLCIAWFGGNNIIAGDMLLGDFTAFLSYVMQILMSLMMVAACFLMIVLSRASMDRICQIQDEVIDIIDPENAIDEDPADGSIDFNNVYFSYGKNKDLLNLENIDVHINSGETIGIIGSTGSGKTSFVQLIPRLYDVLEGSVKVGGKDVREYKLDNLRGAIGMVLQKNVLFSGTIKDNLKWGNPDATDEQIEHATKAAQAHDFIMSFPDGYNTYLGQGGVNVSGGQKQRLCIARALLKHPKIMILDDSTSAVDTATDKLIRDGFKAEFSDTTVLIIAQRIGSVQESDRIIVMDNGKIDAIGTHEELLNSNQIYQDVYYSQQKGSDEAADNGEVK